MVNVWICPFCGEKQYEAPLHVPVKQPSGLNQTRSCFSCAFRNGLYCGDHGVTKTNFSGGHKSVCLECLESAFEAAKGEAAFYIQELRNGLSEERWDIFSNQAAELLTFISEGAELSILRLLVTRSLQNGQTLEETLKRVCGLIPQEHVPASAMESFHPAV